MVDEHEIEDKYDVDEHLSMPQLDGLPDVASVTVPDEHDLEATYFDTPDLVLTTAGITLRRRTGGDDAGWHLKLPSGQGRYEAHEPLGRATKTVPKPLRATVWAFVHDQRLSPIATVRTTRQIRRLIDAGGRVLAEVCDDRVTTQTHERKEHPAITRSWREWEVELVEGDRDLLKAASKLLFDYGTRQPAASSKLVRALGARPAGEVSRQRSPRRKGPASDVVGARLAELVTEIRRRDPLVRRDAPDGVHKMRVAVRRLRNALATFRPVLDHEVTDPLRDELAWIAGSLGGARDVHVLRARLEAALASEPPETLRGPAEELIANYLGPRYREAHARCLTDLESNRYFDLLDRLDELMTTPPWTEQADAQARTVLTKRVRHDYKRLARRVAAVDDAHAADERAALLHEVRKAAKRTRYAAEPLTGLYGKKARRFVRAMKRIQSLLGENHDSNVARKELQGLADRAVAVGQDSFTFGVLHSREETIAKETHDEFAAAWRQASDKTLRGWLS